MNFILAISCQTPVYLFLNVHIMDIYSLSIRYKSNIKASFNNIMIVSLVFKVTTQILFS